MNKKEILKYVTETPYNSNPAVLSDMLDALTEGDESGETEDLEKYLTVSIAITNSSEEGEISVNYPTVSNNKIVMNGFAQIEAGETITIRTFQYARPYVYTSFHLTVNSVNNIYYSPEFSLYWLPNSGGAIVTANSRLLSPSKTECSIDISVTF